MQLNDAQLEAFHCWIQKKEKNEFLKEHGVDSLKLLLKNGYPEDWARILATSAVEPEPSGTSSSSVTPTCSASRALVLRITSSSNGTRPRRRNIAKRQLVSAPKAEEAPVPAHSSKESNKKRDHAIRLANNRNRIRQWANSSGDSSSKGEKAIRFAVASAELQTGVVEDTPVQPWHERLMKRAFNGNGTHEIRTRHATLAQLAQTLNSVASP